VLPWLPSVTQVESRQAGEEESGVGTLYHSLHSVNERVDSNYLEIFT